MLKMVACQRASTICTARVERGKSSVSARQAIASSDHIIADVDQRLDVVCSGSSRRRCLN